MNIKIRLYFLSSDNNKVSPILETAPPSDFFPVPVQYFCSAKTALGGRTSFRYLFSIFAPQKPLEAAGFLSGTCSVFLLRKNRSRRPDFFPVLSQYFCFAKTAHGGRISFRYLVSIFASQKPPMAAGFLSGTY